MGKVEYSTDSICWNITNRCNMNCDFCFRDVYGSDLSLEENINILHILKEKGIKKITFAGGEALLYHDFIKILEEAYTLGFECRLITNGSNFYESYQYRESNVINDDDKIKLDEVLPYLNRITFSCDRLSKYENDEIGRQLVTDSSYDPAESIFYLIELIRQKYNSEELEIDINTITLRDINGNYFYLDDMEEKINDYKELINKWKILIFYGLRGKALDKKDLYQVPKEDINSIKQTYSKKEPELTISVKDNDDMDENLVLSNNGVLKYSSNGKEYELCDLKEYMNDNNQELTVDEVDKVISSKQWYKKPIELIRNMSKNRGEEDV